MKDFLGEMFNMNSLGEHRKGQFFTPYHVSKLMGRLHCINLKVDIENKDFITMCEPCCGSGGMVIAFADCMKDEGINFQQKLYVEAMDIEEICYKMAYLQLSLLGIAAKVQLYTHRCFLSMGFTDDSKNLKKLKKYKVVNLYN